MSKAKDSIYQGQPVIKKDGTKSGPMYYVVNPAGAVHRVGREKTFELLKNAQYRLATDAEIERFKDNRIQAHNDTFGAKWDPQPDILVNVPEPKVVEVQEIPATQGARELAVENGIDLAMISGTGSGGQIIKPDIQKYLKSMEDETPPPAVKIEE